MASSVTPTPLEQPVDQAGRIAVAGFVQTFCTYYSLLLMVTGSVCNPLVFVVFSRRTYRHSTIAFYLRIVSVSDLAAILNGVVTFFVFHAIGIDLKDTQAKCQMVTFFAQVFLNCSHWTLVIVTIERAISITRPHTVRSLCTEKVAKVSICFVFLMSVALAVTYALLWGPFLVFDEQTNKTAVVASCTIMFVNEDINLVAAIVDTTIIALLPCLLILVLNIIIINGVIKSKKRVLKADKKIETCVPDSEDYCGKITSRKTNTGGTGCSNSEDNRKKREASMTRTLLCVNTVFAICVFPLHVWTLGPHFQTPEGMGEIGTAITDILIVFLYSNNALNFLLYCVTGSKFRAELTSVFRNLFYIVLPYNKRK